LSRATFERKEVGDSEQILVMAITKWRFLSKDQLFA